MISIVIPTYNESAIIGSTLERLNEIITSEDEIIVVDGSSEDNTQEIVRSFSNIKLIVSQRGRGVQMNAGGEMAKEDYILFLHADALIDKNCLSTLKNKIIVNKIHWGWFSFKLDSPKFIYRVIETGANMRNRLTGSPLGDHCIYVNQTLFRKVGGFPEISIMGDVEFVRKLRIISNGVEIRAPLKVSVRRFERSGIIRTLSGMWVLRLLYYLGVSPGKLSMRYRNTR